jgi:hypothetical protein
MGPAAVCKNSNAVFYVTSADNSLSFIWTVPADVTIVSGQGTDTLRVTWGMTIGDVSVIAENDCGVSNMVVKSVGVISLPEPAGVITGKDTLCQGQGNYNYSIPAINGATQYVWSLPAGVTISAGQGTNEVTLLLSGTAQSGNLSVQGQNDCGTGTESVKALTVKNCTGIGQNNLEAMVRIFPNPVSGDLTIIISGKESQLDMTISDMNGKVQYSEKLSGISADFRKKLNMSGFAKGVYFLKLSNNERVYTEKVIVQ